MSFAIFRSCRRIPSAVWLGCYERVAGAGVDVGDSCWSRRMRPLATPLTETRRHLMRLYHWDLPQQEEESFQSSERSDIGDPLEESRLVSHQQSLTSKLSYKNVLTGFRPGEVTVVFGAPAIGKSVLVSQLCADLAVGGKTTFWACLENSADGIASLLEKQIDELFVFRFPNERPTAVMKMVKLCEEKDRSLFEITQKLRDGTKSVGSETFSHLVIDSMQAAVTNTPPEKRLQSMDHVFSVVKCIATDLNIHITLIMHPHELTEVEDFLTRTSIPAPRFFTDSDNVLILNRLGADRWKRREDELYYMLELARCRRSRESWSWKLLYSPSKAVFEPATDSEYMPHFMTGSD
eukprot:scpid75723/ scgid25206/ Twinkle protein, mitochondrial; Progressive external ophthalmoplegia 1 protein; T7 gp4-like protein with intramitochondrial nucleoid localization; T7-like mitochondrial DNA helicase